MVSETLFNIHEVLGVVARRVTSKFSGYDLQIVHGEMLIKSSQAKYDLLAVTFMINRLLCIYLLTSKNK